MIRGIFTGRVRLDYALHRHPLWIEHLEGIQKKETPELTEKTEQPLSMEAPEEEEVDESGMAVCGVSEAAELNAEPGAAPVAKKAETAAPASDDNADKK